jgi:hypothetical protein
VLTYSINMTSTNATTTLPANTAPHRPDGFTTIPRTATFWEDMNPIATPELRQRKIYTL